MSLAFNSNDQITKKVVFNNHLLNRLYISKTFCANYNSFILILKYPIIFMRFSVLANFSIFLASSSFTLSLNYICNMTYISKDMNLNNTGNDSL